jgi:hypothetical protein
MTSTDIKKAARRVLEEIFPADDEAALAELISEDFVKHEAPAGTPPGLASITDRWAVRDDAALMRQLTTPSPEAADQMAVAHR